MAQRRDQRKFAELQQTLFIECAYIIFRPQKTCLRMMHPHQGLGTCQTFTTEIDLRLIPDIEPMVRQCLVDRDTGDSRAVRAGNAVPLLAVLMRRHFVHLSQPGRGYSGNALNYWYERNWIDFTTLLVAAVSAYAASAYHHPATPTHHSARRCPAQQNPPMHCRLFRIAVSP